MTTMQSDTGEMLLSRLVGLDETELRELLPAPIRALTGRGDGRRSHDLRAEVDWFMAGEPVLVLVGVDTGASEVIVAGPYDVWDGHTPVLHAGTEVRHRLDGGPELRAWLRSNVTAVVAERRSSFRRCGSCQRYYPPEHVLHEPGKWMVEVCCHGCAARQGTVF
jgi:hypothetical protein